MSGKPISREKILKVRYRLGSAAGGERSAALGVLRSLLTDTGVALPELICKLITRIERRTREQIIRLAVWSVRGLARGAQRVVRESRRAGRSQSQKLVRCLQSGSCARERSRWVAMAADGHPGVRIDTGDVKLIDMVRDLIWQYVAIPTENELIATWPSGMSDWWRDQWSEFKSLLQLHPGDNCKVWTDWYEDRLDARMIDRAVELDRATIRMICGSVTLQSSMPTSKN